MKSASGQTDEDQPRKEGRQRAQHDRSIEQKIRLGALIENSAIRARSTPSIPACTQRNMAEMAVQCVSPSTCRS
jgi:hypothetical protein